MRRDRVAAVAATTAYAVLLVATWSLIENVNDYAGFVAGARALLAGQSPYDPSTWPTAYLHLGTQRPDTAVFGYPGWIALAFLPLAPLPIAIGSLVWNVGTFALALAATRRLARRTGAPLMPSLLVAAASWPAFLVFLQGQWAYLLYALAVATYLDLDDRRDGRAGAWWALAILAKPQLFVIASLVLALFCLRERRWRVLAVTAVIVLVAVIASAIVFPGWWTPWLGAVASHRLARSTQQPTFAGLAGDVAGDRWPVAWGVIVGVLALAIAWAARRSRGDAGAIVFAGVLTLSVGAALYSWSYDQYLAVAAAIVTLALATRAAGRAVALATYALFGPLALALWLVAFARYHDTASGLVPLLAIALLVIAAARPAASPRAAPYATPSTRRHR